MTMLIYTTQTCPYCVKAKALLEKKEISYQEIDVSQDQDLRLALIEKAGGRKTVPQIFWKERHLGGCDDLYALEKSGELDKIIKDL